MFSQLKEYWNRLKQGRPGSRFQEQYDRERGAQANGVARVLRVIGGLALIPIGLFFLAVPGPGLLFIALGAVLIAREFRSAARALDWIEDRGRRVYGQARRALRKLVAARREVPR